MSVVVYALCSLLVISQALSGVKGITNAEFFDQLKDYITDLEVQDSDASSVITHDVSDVIELPGGPDDEIDLVYLFRKIGFTLTEGCVNVEYLETNKGFMVTFTLNDRQVYRKEISLRNPPAMCYGTPGLQGFARVCLQFYNVDLGSRRACAKLVGVIDLKVKKFSVDLGLGCFGIPIVQEESSLNSAPEMQHEGHDPDRKIAHVLFRHVQYLEIKESSPQKTDKIGTAEGNEEDNWMSDESDAEVEAG